MNSIFCMCLNSKSFGGRRAVTPFLYLTNIRTYKNVLYPHFKGHLFKYGLTSSLNPVNNLKLQNYHPCKELFAVKNA